MMPQIILGDGNRGYVKDSGITVYYRKNYREIDISGWYDGFVGIQGERLTLAQFFKRLKITAPDCAKAFEELKKERKNARNT